MFLLWSALASAAPCPDVDALLDEAQSAFDEAEVDLARARISAANAALSCQERPVDPKVLLELYHLDALASVAAEDKRAAVYAIIRGVTLDPDAPPLADVGPELLAEHRSWAARLREDTVLVARTDPSVKVWIDGTPVGAEPATVVAGEHLVQVRGPSGWTSGVTELTSGRGVGALPLRVTRPLPVERPPVDVGVALPPPPPRRDRVHLGVAIGGSAVALAGAGLIVGGSILESRFDADPYDDEVYGGCRRGAACWEDARADAIGRDASTANALYLTGYGLAGVGVGIVGIELLVVRTDSAGMRVRGRW
jgi:hypothetical protein